MNVGESPAAASPGNGPVTACGLPDDLDGPDRHGRPGTPYEMIDCRGQRCPAPVIELARRIGEIPIGAVLRVLADDPAAASDIPAWCRIRGQQFLGEHGLGEHGAGGVAAFDVRRLQ